MQAKLFLAILLSIPQFYIIPIGDSYLSIAAISAISILFTDPAKYKHALSGKSIVILLLLVACQLLSLAWSEDFKLGFKTISVLIIFVAIYAATYKLVSASFRQLILSMRYLGAFWLLAAVSTIAFRVSPALEDAYLQSPLAMIFLGPALVDQYAFGNLSAPIVDPDKSAGFFFMNANVAACYLGISGILIRWLSTMLHSKNLKHLAYLSYFSVFFAGSKASIMLGVIVLSAAAVFARKYSKSTPLSKVLSFLLTMTSLLLGSVLIVLIYSDSLEFLNGFLGETRDTSQIRFWIWSYASDAFMQSPIFGQGFGGWQSGFSRYADEWNEGFPPHNTLVYLWSQSGIFAVLLALLFMVSVLHAAIKLMRIGGKDDYFLGLSLLMTSFWLFVQGMGENWGLVGEAHQEVLFAVLLAMVNVRLRIYASAQQAVEHRAIPQRQIRQ